ncbi:MAG: thiol-disulfide isomerase [Herbaspirillum sp.]|jgi:circadian clock protein KaiB|nr:thiol-disulfide isomerase [Herbaspirillum sp.]
MIDTSKAEIQTRQQQAGTEDPSERFTLRLYVTGTTSRSMLAIKNLQRICEKHLAGMYDLEVIDIYQYPEAAAHAQIIAAPTLIKLSPAPLRRAIGDLSNEDKVLFALNLPANDRYGS